MVGFSACWFWLDKPSGAGCVPKKREERLIKSKRPLRAFGAETGNRTQDTTIFSRVLYQLSYLGSEENFTR